MAYKHDYDKILTRLTRVLSRLNDGEELSVKELASEFNVSERTIQRDLNERLNTFPIYQDKKRWKMQDNFRLEKSSSVEEVVVLDIMQKIIESAGRTFSIKANKLLSKIKNDTVNPIYAKLDIEDIGDKLQEVQLLESAITKRYKVICQYHTKKRLLEPLKIVNFEGFWYLLAIDCSEEILKKYYLKDLKQLDIQDETFTVSNRLESLLENSISIWFNVDEEPYRVTLQISSEIAKYFERKPISKTQKIEEIHQDGSMKISVEITKDMEIIPLIKYWMPYIKVLEPLRINEVIREDVSAYLKID